MSTILDRIVEVKWKEIEDAKRAIPAEQIRKLAQLAPEPLDFYSAISKPNRLCLIAEVKKASPSKGIIREDFDPVAIAQAYRSGGADAISVLTDVTFFHGSLEYLKEIRKAVDLPLLRKDFILDPYQVYEARAAGADAILLIAECLTRNQLKELHDLARSLGMYTLIELYDQALLQNVLDTGTKIVGVNNRDLHSFQVDLEHSIRMRREIPADRCLVGESGISGAEDAERLWKGGVQAILVGETLMRQADIARGVRELLDFSS